MLTSNPYLAEDGDRRGGTVGLPLPGICIRVRGDEGRDVPTGEIGGIEVRGPNVFKGYRSQRKTNKSTLGDVTCARQQFAPEPS
jgi:malonyl-CoA/methylmalonyl-CoA synthetase